jgi:prophage maintenance system killer protein
MEAFLNLTGLLLVAEVDDHEQLMLNVASGKMGRDAMRRWLDEHTESASS